MNACRLASKDDRNGAFNVAIYSRGEGSRSLSDGWPTLSGNSVGHSRCGHFHSVGRIQVDFGLKWKRRIDRSMDQLTIAVPSASEHGGGEEEELLQVFLTLYPAPALSF